MVANDAADTLKARGDMLETYLEDIPVYAREVALHGVCHGATVTLVIAQTC